MTAVKRSAAVTLCLSLFAPLLGCSVASGGSDSAPAAVTEELKPVAVLTTGVERAAGVHRHPLKPGQSLLFVLEDADSPEFTMAAVTYPLVLRAVDEHGKVLGERRMRPCKGSASECPTYRVDVETRYWVEHRPKRK